MSTWEIRTLTCPHCDGSTSAELARGIHGSRVPAVRAAVLARRFHQVACEACGARIEVARSILYTDLERGHWVMALAPSAWPAWRDHERALFDGVARGFTHGSPLVTHLAPNRVRLVRGYEGLREKLVLWQHGHDDALIECVKARLLANAPEFAAAGSSLIVDAVADDGALAVAWWPAADAPRPTRTVEVPAAWVADADRDRDRLRARFPELFAGGLVSLARVG
ncbi:MAG: hypothetical protein IPH44_29610 [Myxococcales bacterium]|nr:hypothetical protein [Myxococcales bacterium]MBK7192145.1 hypothetical protein [Myxococcales bacterium]MBP6848962.1 hypothetical protein [Kofleriaceae bacterium]